MRRPARLVVGRGRAVLRAGVAVAALSGCAYFNTFYNAKKYYGEGERLAAEDSERSGLPPQARTAFEKSIEKSSAVLTSHAGSSYVDDALLLLGKAHYRLGNFEEAAAALRTLLEEHPQSGLRREAALWLVRSGAEGGDPETAMRLAKELLVEGELSAEDRTAVELERAKLALRAGEPARAVAIYDALQRSAPELARRHEVGLLLARARLEAGEDDAALRELRALITAEAGPELRRKAALATAEALASAGRSHEAREAYHELLREEIPDSIAARIHVALAESYRASGEFQRAAAELGAAAGLTPSTALASTALYRRGLLEWRVLDSREAAKQTFLEAYLQDPQAPVADSATAAARTIQEIQHYQAILSGSQRVLAPIPPEEVRATATYLLAELLYTQEGDLEEARALFADVLERYPRSAWTPKVLYTLGWLADDEARASGDAGEIVPEAAAAYYRRLVEEYPRTEYGRYARERLASSPAELAARVAPGGSEASASPPALELFPADEPPEDTPPDTALRTPLAPAAEESTDAKLLAFSRALPRPADPLVGIQDRLLARQRADETAAASLRPHPSEGGRDRLLAAERRAEDVAGLRAGLRDSLPSAGDSLPFAGDSLRFAGDSLRFAGDSLRFAGDSLPAATSLGADTIPGNSLP